MWEGLTSALVQRRRIELAYRSPQQEDSEPRRHVADPYERFFDTVRGHYYLRGWCHCTDGPLGRRDQRRYFSYRLGRIAALEMLSNKLPPFPPSAPRYAVVYELMPQVARLGVTRHREIAIIGIEQREDGSAVVRGTTDNPFWMVRTLLHYGPNCQVIGGPEMKREMRKVVGQMAELYQEKGGTIFVSSHLVNEISGIVDHVGLIREGRLHIDMSLDDLRASVRRIRMTFADDVPSERITCPGILRSRVEGREAVVSVRDFSVGHTLAALRAYEPSDLEVEDLNLEDIFIELVAEE